MKKKMRKKKEIEITRLISIVSKPIKIVVVAVVIVGFSKTLGQIKPRSKIFWPRFFLTKHFLKLLFLNKNNNNKNNNHDHNFNGF